MYVLTFVCQKNKSFENSFFVVPTLRVCPLRRQNYYSKPILIPSAILEMCELNAKEFYHPPPQQQFEKITKNF